MSDIIFKTTFWTSAFLLFYTFFGYPIFLNVVTSFIKRNLSNNDDMEDDVLPFVSLLIPAFNEESVIRRKIENSLLLDYPRSKMEIVVASDGSTDDTNRMVSAYSKKEIRIILYKKRRGKSEVINRTVPKLIGDIVIFTDASAMLAKDAIKKIVEDFRDSNVGCVSGKYVLVNGDESNRGNGEGLYFKYETNIKSKESEYNSILGAHGSLYGIRKKLFKPLEKGTINDDYIIPMQIVEQGYRSVYANSATAMETAKTTIEGEMKRRIRINTGNIQQLFFLRGLLNPLKGKIAFQFISHKLFRILSPLLIIAMLISSMISEGAFYRIVFVMQLLFYSLGIINYYLEKHNIKIKILSIPFYFTFGSTAILRGIYKYFIMEREVLWDKVDA